ncbi:MAG TPA: hypothetical protein VHT96_00805 [Clostridia bacterium]|nr:hypothetical protein [Clostridia bacterium]
MSRFIEFIIAVTKVVVFLRNTAKGILDSTRKILISLLKRFAAYWRKPISAGVRLISTNICVSGTRIKRIIIASMLSAFAAIMQSAGALGGPGFIISSLVTLPVALAAILSIPTGAAAYSVTLFLLVILQPSEIIVFPFTTGLLGLGIGLGLKLFKTRAAVIAFAALCLTMGISFLLYILRFPVLGPISPSGFSFIASAAIYTFSYLYSWLWTEIGMIALKFLDKAIVKAS